jgi:hypothetical protein
MLLRNIELRNKSDFKINIVMQVDALSHRISALRRKSARQQLNLGGHGCSGRDR